MDIGEMQKRLSLTRSRLRMTDRGRAVCPEKGMHGSAGGVGKRASARARLLPNRRKTPRWRRGASTFASRDARAPDTESS